VTGRDQIRAFLAGKWEREHDYRLVNALGAFAGNRIAVRFRYEWHDGAGNWFRSCGNELWDFHAAGLMRRRGASINDLVISEDERRFHWPLGRRPGLDEPVF
jgi:nuclear transport factor 2 (NTF2) superfamily protein